MEIIDSGNIPKAVKKAYNKYGFVLKFYFVLAFIAQIALTLSYCFGIATIYGQRAEVLTMINFAFGVLNMGKAYYHGIFGCSLAILYFVLLVTMITNVIRSITIMKKGFSKLFFREEAHQLEDFWKLFWSMSQGVSTSVVGMILFASAVDVVKAYDWSTLMIACIFIAIAVFLLGLILYYVLSGYSFKSTATNFIYYLICITSIALIFVNTRGAHLEGVFAGIGRLVYGSFNFQQAITSVITIVKSAIMIGVVYYAVSSIDAVFTYMPYNRWHVKSKATPILYMIGICLIGDIASCGLGGNRIAYTTIIDAVLSYIPLILAVAALNLFVYLTLETASKKAVEESEIAESQEENYE